MAANANAHFEPKVLSFLQDTSSIVQHRDSGNARALEKSGDLGKHNVRMYVQLRMAMWTLLTLRGNMWALLNRDQQVAGQPATLAADRLPRPVPVAIAEPVVGGAIPFGGQPSALPLPPPAGTPNVPGARLPAHPAGPGPERAPSATCCLLPPRTAFLSPLPSSRF